VSALENDSGGYTQARHSLAMRLGATPGLTVTDVIPTRRAPFATNARVAAPAAEARC